MGGGERMTILRCDKCAEYEEKYCQLKCEVKNPGNTCKNWIDNDDRIKNTREINKDKGFDEDISVEEYRRRYE